MSQGGLAFCRVKGSVSDLLGLRLPLPRSRPAQISDGTLDTAEQLTPILSNKQTDVHREPPGGFG
jgi:hypothetical protein